MSHRGYTKTAARRERLRKEGKERQDEYDKLTIQQKLDRLPPPPHAERQRKKLMAQLESKSKPLTKGSEMATILTPSSKLSEENDSVHPTPKAKDRRKQERK